MVSTAQPTAARHFSCRRGLVALIGATLLIAAAPTGAAAQHGGTTIRNGAPAETAPERRLDPNLDPWDPLLHLVPDAAAMLVAPTRWGRADWLRASGLTVATVFLIAGPDAATRDMVLEHRNGSSGRISAGMERLGDHTVVVPGLIAGYAVGALIENERLRNTTLNAIVAVGLSSLLTSGGKLAAHRVRPRYTDDPQAFQGPGTGHDDHPGFPSGHTGTAFATATVLAQAYGDSRIIPLLAYSAATLAGLSRVHDNQHWASDVLVGAAAGYFAGNLVQSRRGIAPADRRAPVVIPAVSATGRMFIEVRLPIH